MKRALMPSTAIRRMSIASSTQATGWSDSPISSTTPSPGPPTDW
jgi:hypothetical protein